ncbi:hypothetical protein HY346_03130 [Candidatus Microgenomates bacterium]|nr:hypothetical protein [Candidatus Microgenomates bacterium]
MANRNLLNTFKAQAGPGLVVLLAALARLLPHLPNLTPIGGLALFGGAHLSRKSAYLLPLAAMFLSDLVLGFHSTMPYVYVSFVLAILIGRKIGKNPNAARLVAGVLGSAAVFYLVTNFGVWVSGSLYPKTLAGLGQSYVMALPFFRNSLTGDLVYSGVFFYGYQLASVFAQKLRLVGPRSK